MTWTLPMYLTPDLAPDAPYSSVTHTGSPVIFIEQISALCNAYKTTLLQLPLIGGPQIQLEILLDVERVKPFMDLQLT